MTSVRFLPTGVFSALIAGVSSKLINYVNPKWTILAGLLVTLCVSITLPFADSRIRCGSSPLPIYIRECCCVDRDWFFIQILGDTLPGILYWNYGKYGRIHKC